MLTFLLYTVVFWIANICFVRIAYILIQPGQLFGAWQNVLARLYDANSRFLNALAKPLGDCELCFSHFLTLISFFAYYFFAKVVLHYWITEGVGSWLAIVLVNLIWYLSYASIGSILSLLVLLRAKRKVG